MLVLDNWSQIEGDHQVGRSASASESDSSLSQSGIRGDRMAAIACAQRAIEAYEPEYLRNRRAAEEERADRIALAESGSTFEDGTLPALRG